MEGTIAVVTDSTASLAPELARGRDIRVVPLQVVLAGQAHDDTTAACIGVFATLRHGMAPTTSRPAPGRFSRVYAEAAAAGASGIVSVHLSGRMSGTVDSARLAAAAARVPVLVVDTRTVGAGLGFAVLTAADAARSGRPLAEVAAAAARRSERLRSWFCLAALDHLRHGGRMGGATTLPGTTLTVKSLMRIEDGQVVPFERVRTMARAVVRLEQLAVEFAAEGAPVDLAVQHMANSERAAELARRLRERIPDLRTLHISDVGTVIAAHTGPNMLGVVVAPD